MGILQLLAKENYIAYHKTIARSVGVDEAILFGELCSMSNLYGQEFFCEQSKLMNDTCLTEYRVRNALKNLQKEALVSVEKKGLPAKNYYVLNEKRLLEILEQHSTSAVKFDTTGNGEFNSTGDIKSNSTFNKNTGTKNTSSKNTSKKESKITSFDAIISEYAKKYLEVPMHNEITDLLGEWLKVRKAKRAAMTDRAIQMNIDKLDRLANESGMSVIDYLKEVICRGWAAFYVINNYSNKPKETKEEPKRYGGTYL